MTLIGVDEVGRGCIAGNLLVCAYAFNKSCAQTVLERAGGMAMDSKAFKSRPRREAAECSMRAAGLFEFVEATPDVIDEMNIRGATIWAMREASMRLAQRIQGDVEVIFDGRDVPDNLDFKARSLIKGDTLVAEISAASIMAKVKRDNDMVEASKVYPGYGFEKHSGYGTKQHLTAIGTLGLTDIHRSWARKFR